MDLHILAARIRRQTHLNLSSEKFENSERYLKGMQTPALEKTQYVRSNFSRFDAMQEKKFICNFINIDANQREKSCVLHVICYND